MEEFDGIDLQNYDYPEDEVFDQNLQVDEILEGLNWYAGFQINVLNRRRKRDAVARTFIEKLESEMKQSQTVVYKHFAQFEEAGEEFSIDQFAGMELSALCQLLGTFMPIVKLQKEDSYMIGTEAK